MKKLMMAIVAGLLATATYATNVKWGMNAGNIGTKFANATIYLVYDASSATASYMAALAGKSGTYSTSDITGTLVTGASGTVDSTGSYVNGTGVTVTPTTLGVTAGYKKFYVVAISADGLSLAYTTSDKQVNIQTSALSATAYWNGTSDFATITAAPEPTCMALLLMGVALVGLRRKAVR